MGFRQALKRLASVRSRPRRTTSDGDQDADGRMPINSPYQALAEEPEESAADRHSSDFLEPFSDRLPSASERASSEPRKPTGKRKPSDASRLRRQSTLQQRARSEEPRPQDYLYFGDGGRSLGRSSASTNQAQVRSSSATARLTVPNQQISGRDNSGFLNTGMSNPQMGSTYQSLTYGGSLQYDYSGTQAPGTDGF